MSEATPASTTATRAGRPASLHRRLGVVGWAVDAAAVLACVVYAARLSAGMDVSFDQISYHYYYSWLLFHGGIDQVDPEPFTNRYVSPLAQLPWYVLDSVLSPRGTAAAIAALAGLNLPLVRRISMRMLPARVGDVSRLALGVAAMLLAGTGAVFRLSLGTSLSDVIVTVPVLGALLCVLVAADDGVGPRRRTWLVLLAGLFAGVAVGAKLTMGPFVVALVVVVGCLAVARRTVLPVVWLAVGGLVGVVVAGGWWFLDVWRATGSPTFPYYNAVFKSPWWPLENFRDTRFGPRSLADALQFPNYMLQGTRRLLDYELRDARWVVLEVLVALALVVGAVGLARARRRPSMPTLPSLVVWAFFLVGALLWLVQFGIARYAAPVELLSGVVLVALVLTITRRPVVAVAGSVVLALAMAPWVKGHVEHVPFAADRYGIKGRALQDIPAGSEVLVNAWSAPSGFLLAEVPATSRRHIIHPWFFGSPLLERLKRDEISKAPRIYVIVSGKWRSSPKVIAAFEKAVGVRLDESTCVPIPNHVRSRALCSGTWVGGS
ncbi:hypothetical protein [Terrabacter sp. NPDC080008]|uniref:hypothetical protein n=1 Tax=Terrabacter sp. NPDC080008 TaxID=3155176 RepID=UPI00344E8B64